MSGMGVCGFCGERMLVLNADPVYCAECGYQAATLFTSGQPSSLEDV